MIIDTDFVVYVGKDYLVYAEKTGQSNKYIAKLYNTGYHHKNPRIFEEMPLNKSLEWAILMARLWQLDLDDIPYAICRGDKILTVGWEFLEKFKIPFTCTFKEHTIFDFPEVLETWKRQDISVLGSQFRIYKP